MVMMMVMVLITSHSPRPFEAENIGVVHRRCNLHPLTAPVVMIMVEVVTVTVVNHHW